MTSITECSYIRAPITVKMLLKWMRHSYAAALTNLRHWLEGCVEDSLGKTIPNWLQHMLWVRTHTHSPTHAHTHKHVVWACTHKQTFLIASGVWTVADNVMVITISLLNKYSHACGHPCTHVNTVTSMVQNVLNPFCSVHNIYEWRQLDRLNVCINCSF